MRQQFYECKYRYQAVKAMPWASVIVHVCGGYMGFESWDDYNIWKNEKSICCRFRNVNGKLACP